MIVAASMAGFRPRANVLLILAMFSGEGNLGFCMLPFSSQRVTKACAACLIDTTVGMHLRVIPKRGKGDRWRV
jgi:hypothetical protein